MGYNFSKTSNSLIATLDTEDGKYDEHIIECFQPNILLRQERIVLKESSLRVQDFLFESIGQINGETPTNLIDGFEMLESFIKSIFVEESVSTLKTSGTINLNGSFQVLPFDINSCSFSGGKAFLPTTPENGKEILVIAVADNIEIRANATGTNFMFQTFNTFISSVILTTFQMYRFTYIGFGGYWKAELIQGDPGVGASQTLQETFDLGNTVIASTNFKFSIFDSVPGISVENTSTQNKTTLEVSKLTFTKNYFGLKTTNLFQALTPLVNRAIYLPDADGTLAIERAKVSQQINVTVSEPEINTIDYVRIFANDEYQSCKLTGPHTVGKEIYIKNTTAFNVVINGVVENINGNSSLTLPPNTYWHLIKEDGGTNSITAFKLSIA